MSGYHEKLIAENIASRYSEFVLPDGEHINPHAEDAVSESMCNFPDKDIKISKVLMCVNFLQCTSWCFCS